MSELPELRSDIDTRPVRRGRRLRRAAASAALGLALVGATAAPALAATEYKVTCYHKAGGFDDTTNDADQAAKWAVYCVKKGGIASVGVVS